MGKLTISRRYGEELRVGTVTLKLVWTDHGEWISVKAPDQKEFLMRLRPRSKNTVKFDIIAPDDITILREEIDDD
jgi:sRNA-binding carbon storage regulator CsrA